MDPSDMYSTPHQKTKYQHTLKVSERKRALFLSACNNDEVDLGVLELSSSPEKYDSPPYTPERFVSFSALKNITNTMTRDTFAQKNEALSTPHSTASPEKFSFLLESPCKKKNISPTKIVLESPPTQTPQQTVETEVSETPPKESPTSDLKTPQENSAGAEMPRLVRKSLDFDTENNLKRKLNSPADESVKKVHEWNNKVSKARTALFPETFVSTKLFYSKTDAVKFDKNVSPPVNVSTTKKNRNQRSSLFLCSRKTSKGRFGQINAGVRHGIRKPKHRNKISKEKILQAALNIVENSPLNEYLERKENYDNQLSKDQLLKMDSILRNISKNNTANKENTVPATLLVQNNETSRTQKRPLSPQPEINPNRKFFKSGHSSGVVTVNSNIKIKVDHGRMSLIEKKTKRRKCMFDMSLDTSDLEIAEDKMIEEGNVSDIIRSLGDELPEPTQPVTAALKPLETECTVSTKVTEMLSPTSQMCDMTSGLALNSPKRAARNLSAILCKISNENENTSQINRFSSPASVMGDKKLFPIFCGKAESKGTPKIGRVGKANKPHYKTLAPDQYLLDAGQKRFGHTQCKECQLVYHMGDPMDEIMHLNHHNSVHTLRFVGWKNERIVCTLPDGGRILKVTSNDSKQWWKKVNDVIEVVNRDLGYVTDQVSQTSVVFLYISKKQIVGCLVAESKQSAHRLISGASEVDYCSKETYPVKCGISRIWVAAPHRKRGIATSMMNTLRANFIYGYILSASDIAFSSPTDLGKLFAEKYLKMKDFLIYTC